MMLESSRPRITVGLSEEAILMNPCGRMRPLSNFASNAGGTTAATGWPCKSETLTAHLWTEALFAGGIGSAGEVERMGFEGGDGKKRNQIEHSSAKARIATYPVYPCYSESLAKTYGSKAGPYQHLIFFALANSLHLRYRMHPLAITNEAN